MKAAIFKLLFFSAMISLAQKAPVKFGDVSVEELKMTSYDKDSSASAVVLADYGQAVLAYSEMSGFQIKLERTTRIKILKKEGTRWGDFEIPLYKDGDQKEKLSGLKAITYNLANGKIEETKVKGESIFEEKRTKNITITKVALSNVKEGSVVEITYNVLSDFLFNFQDWEFQTTIPVVWSEFRARIPEYYSYEKYMQGYLPMTVNEQKDFSSSITLTSKEQTGGERGSAVSTQFTQSKIDFKEYSFRWAVKDAPAFKSEPFMTTYKDYISKINFELAYIKFPNQPIKTVMGSWEEISKKFNDSEDFGKQVRSNGFLKKIVEEVTLGADTPEKKIEAIYYYVKKNVSWDGSVRMFVEGSLKNILEEKKGSSADINFLLASMLEKADLSVSPVLISTRDHGFIRRHVPVVSQFNYVLCMLTYDGKQLLLDATEKYLPLGTLPERCLNGSGLIVGEVGARWINLESGIKSKTAINSVLMIAPDGRITGKLTFDRNGYHAYSTRKKYFSTGEEDYVKEIAKDRLWEVKKSEFKSADQITEPFIETHEVEVNEHATVTADIIYINPYLTSRIVENPFKTEQRDYPVNFGSPFDHVYQSQITIPEGYQVDELPQGKIIALPENGARFRYSATQLNNTILITSILNVNRPIFTQDEYPNLREFYNQVVSKEAEQIVLRKK